MNEDNGGDSESEQERNEANEESSRTDTTDEEEEQFDITLPASHSYMGSRLSVVRGRAALEAGWRGRVPASAHGAALFPGETVPLLLTDSRDVALMRRALDSDKLFALLCPDETGSYLCGRGVLCEVYEAAVGGEAGEEGGALSVKARAVHRVQLPHLARRAAPLYAYNRMSLVEVEVLGESTRCEPLQLARLASLDAARRSTDPAVEGIVRGMDAALSGWPRFVFDMFHYRRLRDQLANYFSSITTVRLPEDPVSLSFWVAGNLPLRPHDRLAMLRCDSPLLRLYHAAKLAKKKGVLVCSSCSEVVALRENIFAMSSEGVHSNYTNLGGYMHDIMTVSRVESGALAGAASAEFSWFPGYAWTVAVCAVCAAHLGWRFEALKKRLRPQQFYGLTRSAVQPRNVEVDSDVEDLPDEI